MLHRRNRKLHSLRIIALAAALGISVVALSQCRMVSDNVTGVTLTARTLAGKAQCTKDCNSTYEDAIRAEEVRYRAALRACGADNACRDAENALHNQNVDVIQDARKACKKSCYNEGGGDGR